MSPPQFHMKNRGYPLRKNNIGDSFGRMGRISILRYGEEASGKLSLDADISKSAWQHIIYHRCDNYLLNNWSENKIIVSLKLTPQTTIK